MLFDMDQVTYVNPLRSKREAIDLTREELARLAETSTSTVARMELQGHIPNGATLARLAAVLGTTTDALLSPTQEVAS